MFGSVSRTLGFLARTPLIQPPSGPAAMELSNMSGPSRRPRAASRTFSNLSVRSGYNAYAMDGRRGYASDKGRQELYSDETGSLGAGIDDVAHTDAAFDKNPDPESSAKKIEKETGKDFTNKSSSNPDYSKTSGKQGETGGENALNTSKFGDKK
ncbi:uncharacterized protein MKK02DRAFT_38049 [Dioszegia hungarica]|uniref:Uncharacterized protein n=1 Tax=Dioszegia hungarica TaxID=4972 RepID=A0AA38H5R0_9TREE|nr:uncharacterized protein MKK02DRAFT_38049 [Dioszegia hungarica]KAI9634518.1 hypothetical protein MKK02DRAFT_38049 [Dioszegia hungarica]